MKKILVFVSIIAVLFSCDKAVKPLIFSEENFISEDLAIVEVNIPKMKGPSESAKAINNKLNEFIISSISDKKPSISVKEAVESFNKLYVAFSENLEQPSQPWEVFIDGEVTYQSSEVISIALNTYKNTGGASGNSVITFLNFNPSNGVLYKKEDVIEYMDELKKLASKHFKKALSEEGISIDNFNEKKFKTPETIGFSEDGLVFVYNQYELEAYSLKLLEFTIPLQELSSLLLLN